MEKFYGLVSLMAYQPKPSLEKNSSGTISPHSWGGAKGGQFFPSERDSTIRV